METISILETWFQIKWKQFPCWKLFSNQIETFASTLDILLRGIQNGLVTAVSGEKYVVLSLRQSLSNRSFTYFVHIWLRTSLFGEYLRPNDKDAITKLPLSLFPCRSGVIVSTIDSFWKVDGIVDTSAPSWGKNALTKWVGLMKHKSSALSYTIVYKECCSNWVIPGKNSDLHQ